MFNWFEVKKQQEIVPQRQVEEDRRRIDPFLTRSTSKIKSELDSKITHPKIITNLGLLKEKFDGISGSGRSVINIPDWYKLQTIANIFPEVNNTVEKIATDIASNCEIYEDNKYSEDLTEQFQNTFGLYDMVYSYCKEILVTGHAISLYFGKNIEEYKGIILNAPRSFNYIVDGGKVSQFSYNFDNVGAFNIRSDGTGNAMNITTFDISIIPSQSNDLKIFGVSPLAQLITKLDNLSIQEKWFKQFHSDGEMPGLVFLLEKMNQNDWENTSDTITSSFSSTRGASRGASIVAPNTKEVFQPNFNPKIFIDLAQQHNVERHVYNGYSLPSELMGLNNGSSGISNDKFTVLVSQYRDSCLEPYRQRAEFQFNRFWMPIWCDLLNFKEKNIKLKIKKVSVLTDVDIDKNLFESVKMGVITIPDFLKMSPLYKWSEDKITPDYQFRLKNKNTAMIPLTDETIQVPIISNTVKEKSSYEGIIVEKSLDSLWKATKTLKYKSQLKKQGKKEGNPIEQLINTTVTKNLIIAFEKTIQNYYNELKTDNTALLEDSVQEQYMLGFMTYITASAYQNFKEDIKSKDVNIDTQTQNNLEIALKKLITLKYENIFGFEVKEKSSDTIKEDIRSILASIAFKNTPTEDFDAMVDIILRLLTSFDESDSLETSVKKIYSELTEKKASDSVIANLITFRAETNASVLVATLYSAAQLLTYSIMKIQGKQWGESSSIIPRKEHVSMYGEVVPLSSAFSNGDFWTNLEINCHCYTKIIWIKP
jgi:hypothetical protein